MLEIRSQKIKKFRELTDSLFRVRLMGLTPKENNHEKEIVFISSFQCTGASAFIIGYCIF